MLIIYTCRRSSAGSGRFPYNLPSRGRVPGPGESPDRASPAPAPPPPPGPATRDQLVQAGSCNTSVIRLGKWRHLARRQLRLKPHGPVRKLLSQIIPLKSGQFCGGGRNAGFGKVRPWSPSFDHGRLWSQSEICRSENSRFAIYRFNLGKTDSPAPTPSLPQQFPLNPPVLFDFYFGCFAHRLFAIVWTDTFLFAVRLVLLITEKITFHFCLVNCAHQEAILRSNTPLNKRNLIAF